MTTETLRPNAAGDDTNIPNQEPNSGAHWDKVDEASPDDNTTYVYTLNSISSVRDLYNLPSPSGIVGSIKDVTVWARLKKSNSPFIVAVILVKSGSTIGGSVGKALTTSWANYSHTWITNPDTGLAWTEADIIALQIGISMKGNRITPTFSSCTQLYVVITSSAFIPKVSII